MFLRSENVEEASLDHRYNGKWNFCSPAWHKMADATKLNLVEIVNIFKCIFLKWQRNTLKRGDFQPEKKFCRC